MIDVQYTVEDILSTAQPALQSRAKTPGEIVYLRKDTRPSRLRVKHNGDAAFVYRVHGNDETVVIEYDSVRASRVIPVQEVCVKPFTSPGSVDHTGLRTGAQHDVVCSRPTRQSRRLRWQRQQ